MKMKRWTRRLAGLLVAAMLLSCLPLAAFAAESASVAKAQLGTTASYDGDVVDLSDALYTFTSGEDENKYVIKSTTQELYLSPGTAAKAPNQSNSMEVTLSAVTKNDANWFRFQGTKALYFHNNNATKLHFDHTNGFVETGCSDFALFRQADKGEDAAGGIPGYVRLTALDEVTAGEEYLIASLAGETWYVLYPATGSNYAHAAKVVIEEGEDPGPVDPDPTEPPAPTKPEKPTVTEALYQVEVVCREKSEHPTHWWSSPNQTTWEWVDEFKAGEVEENTAYQPETYPWRCPVTPKETLDTYLERINAKTADAAHTLVTTELPVAYYYYNGTTNAWELVKNEDANPGCTVSTDGKNTWYLSIVVTCADEPDPGPVDPPTPVDPEIPAKPTIDANNDLYQVVVMCQEDQTHYWSYPSKHNWGTTPDQFAVGEVRANDLNNGTAETYPYICPVTPAYSLEQCLSNVNADFTGHHLVTTEATIPVAYYYWNATDGWQLLRDKQPDSNVTFNPNNSKHEGTLTVSVSCADEPDPGPVDPPTPVDPDKPAAPADQPAEGTYTMPSDKLSGTGSSEPMSDADVNSYFRIPALVTLDNGWLVAASDARWTNTNDSPNNLDTIVSVSKDGGATWDWEIVNYFADFAPLQGPTYYGSSTSGNAWGSKTASASFIDPALTIDGSGKLWMLVDMLPSYGGNYTGNRIIASTGFDDQGRLLISHGTADGTASGNAADYAYCVDLNAQPSKTAQKDGKTVGVYPIQARSGGAETGYYVDAFMDLWYDYEDGGMKPVLCRQKDSSHYVQNNIFYQQSEWKVTCTFYIMARSAQVDEESGRLVWSDPKLLNVKNPGERFTAVCPGRGTTVTLADGSERLMFQLYDNATGAERASTVYSDDGGKTWTRGERTDTSETTGKASESQIVHLPNGDLRMYSRNDKAAIRYADSADNGATWGASKLDNALAYCGNNMVSFINVNGVLVGPDNKTYEHVILASYAKESYRSSGVIRIGYVNDDAGQTVTWLNGDAIRFPNRYNYSCLTQLPDHAGFAVLYEQDDTSNPAKGVMAMRFVTFTVADLLGEGWLLTAAKPTESVTLKVDSSLIDLDFGGSRTVAVEYSPEDADVTWASADESVVTVADGVITAVGAGKTTVTVSVTKGALTRTATIPVMVQPESGELILPEQYVDSVATVVTPGVSGYLLTETETLADGNYVIYAERNGVESRVMHNSGNRTDHYRVTVDGKTMTGVIPANHEWTFTKSGEGYTIRSTGDKYLSTTNAVRESQLDLKDESTVFSVAYQGEGVWHIKNGDSYLGFSGGWRMQSESDTLKLFSAFTSPDTTTYTVSADGLTALIRAAGMDKADYADVLALAGTYDAEADAQEALAQINAAAQEVYGQLREGNITRYLVTYTVQDELLAVQSYYPGEIIVPMTDPVRAGYIFTGWTGMPTDKVMPDHDLALVAAFRPVSTGGGSSSGGGSSRPAPTTPPPEEDLNEPDVPLTDAPTVSFVDVAENAWYAKAVAAVAAQGLVKGVGENKFDPAAPMTRSSLAEVLYRLAGSEEQTDAAFADVAQGAWYANAVAWAAKNGVVTGVSDDAFAPDRVITRQELAVMLCRYAKLAGLDTASDAKALEAFSDGGATGDWAVDGVAWCVAQGILEGKGGDVLDPTANVTRAEVAVMLDRFTALLK